MHILANYATVSFQRSKDTSLAEKMTAPGVTDVMKIKVKLAMGLKESALI